MSFKSKELYQCQYENYVNSPPVDHCCFKWYISACKAPMLTSSSGSPKHDDYLSFWLVCAPNDELSEENTTIVCHTSLTFKIKPYDSYVEPSFDLVYNSHDIFDDSGDPNDSNSSVKSPNYKGWYDFAPWKPLFNPENKYVSPEHEIELIVHVDVKGLFRIIPLLSRKKLKLLLSNDQLPYSDLFFKKASMVGVVLHSPDSNGIYQEFPLHFDDHIEYHAIFRCFKKELPENINSCQKSRLMGKDNFKIYVLESDIPFHTFISIVRYFYRREIIIDDSLVPSIYKVSTYLGLDSISRACMFLHLKPTTVCSLLPAVLKHNDHADKALLVNFIREEKNFNKLMREPSFLKLSAADVKYILSLDNLQGPEDLFAEAAYTWAKEQMRKANSNDAPTLKQVKEFLEKKEIFGVIRHSLLLDPGKFLTENDFQWFNFAKDQSKIAKFKYKPKFIIYKVKRKDVPLRF